MHHGLQQNLSSQVLKYLRYLWRTPIVGHHGWNRKIDVNLGWMVSAPLVELDILGLVDQLKVKFKAASVISGKYDNGFRGVLPEVIVQSTEVFVSVLVDYFVTISPVQLIDVLPFWRVLIIVDDSIITIELDVGINSSVVLEDGLLSLLLQPPVLVYNHVDRQAICYPF